MPLPQPDADDVWMFLLLAALALVVAGAKYLMNRAMPEAGYEAGVRDGGWVYLRSGWAMKLMAAFLASMALVMIFPMIQTLQEPAFVESWPDAKAQMRARLAGGFEILMFVSGAAFMAFGAAHLVRPHMRYSDSGIVFRSTFGRETTIPWEDVLEINLSVASPILSYKGWRRKDLCDTCPGYREFLDYAKSRGIRIVEPKQQY